VFINEFSTQGLIKQKEIHSGWHFLIWTNAVKSIGSDVNKDLGPKAKDTGHKVKAKAKALGIKAKAKDLGPKAKAKDLTCQSQ